MFSADLEETKINKPCPFCGEVDNISCVQDSRYGSWMVTCWSCGMTFESDKIHRMSRESTIKHWNARYKEE